MLEELEPRWLLVVGIAGGVPSDELTLGDVVVSNRIVDFSVEAVLQDKPSEYAMMGGPVAKDAAVVLANLRALAGELGSWGSAASIGAARPPIEVDDGEFYGDEAWQAKARAGLARQAARTEPIVTAGAIGSSDRLVKDTKILATFLLKAARQVLAVEMESAGVYRAATGRGVPLVAIRGLSDVVGFKRDPRWTAYACHTAAAFTRAFLCTRPIEPRAADAAPPGQPPPTPGSAQATAVPQSARREVRPVLTIDFHEERGWPGPQSWQRSAAVRAIVFESRTTDPSGRPIWEHPVRIAALASSEERVLGWLHDEDVPRLGIVYDDVQGRQFSTTCEHNANKNHGGKPLSHS